MKEKIIRRVKIFAMLIAAYGVIMVLSYLVSELFGYQPNGLPWIEYVRNVFINPTPLQTLQLALLGPVTILETEIVSREFDDYVVTD